MINQPIVMLHSSSRFYSPVDAAKIPKVDKIEIKFDKSSIKSKTSIKSSLGKTKDPLSTNFPIKVYVLYSISRV